MSKALLSKTTYLKSLQCQKHLYLYKNHYPLQDPLSYEKKAIFARGHNVGNFARKLFPGGIDASPKKISDQAAWVNKTAELISQGIEVIYEAAFIFNDVFVAIDMLVKRENEWYGYEVKSSVKVSPTYVTDAALQHYVISNQEIALKDISIVYVNSNYSREQALEPDKIFHIVSVLQQAMGFKEEIEIKIQSAKNTLAQKQIPDINIGTHCFEPYQCDFKGFCWKKTENDSVFEIAGLSKKEQFELYDAGIKMDSELPETYELKKLPALYLESKTKNQAIIDTDKIKQYLQKIEYPLYFIDFEAIMPAIPIYKGTSPFEFIPFQYSIHYKENINAEPLHFEFLAETGIDPRKSFITEFLKNTKEAGTLLAYDVSGEKKMLNSVARVLPEFEKEIRERVSRLKDLNTPFKELMYYHHSMKGALSIKSVLNSIFPELYYSDLKIKNGNMASVMFESLQTETDIFTIAETRDNLLSYCKMDTLAMVKIFDWMEKLA